MKSILRLITAVLLVGGWGLAALSLHVIRTPDDVPITLVTKDQFGLVDTYVDTCKWTLDDAAQHPMLLAKLIRTGKADVLKHVVDPHGADAATQLTEALRRAPKSNSEKTGPATAQIVRSLWTLNRSSR